MERPLPVLARIPRLRKLSEHTDTEPSETEAYDELPAHITRVLSQTAAFRLLIGIGVVLAAIAISPGLFSGSTDSQPDESAGINDTDSPAVDVPQDEPWNEVDNGQFVAGTNAATSEIEIAPPAPPIPMNEPQPQMSMQPPAETFPFEVADRPDMTRLDGSIHNETVVPSPRNPLTNYPTTEAPVVEPTRPMPAPQQYPSGEIFSPGEATPGVFPAVAPENSGARFAPRPNVPVGYSHSTDYPTTDAEQVNYVEYRDTRNTTAPIIYR